MAGTSKLLRLSCSKDLNSCGRESLEGPKPEKGLNSEASSATTVIPQEHVESCRCGLCLDVLGHDFTYIFGVQVNLKPPRAHSPKPSPPNRAHQTQWVLFVRGKAACKSTPMCQSILRAASTHIQVTLGSNTPSLGIWSPMAYILECRYTSPWFERPFISDISTLRDSPRSFSQACRRRRATKHPGTTLDRAPLAQSVLGPPKYPR